MTLTAFLRDIPHPTEPEIRDALSANLCRCTGYQHIVEADHACQRRDSRYFSARVRRNEDARLLTGRALFVDDVQLPGMLHVAFVRSDHAHGRLKSASMCPQPAQRPGVVAVYTAADLGDYCKPRPLLVPPPPIPGLVFHACTQLPLAQDKVRYVGEPIAMVVAESRYIAEDALRDVVVDIDPLDAVVDLEAALAAGAPLRARASRRRTPRRTSCSAKATTRRPAPARTSSIERRFFYDRGVVGGDREPGRGRRVGRQGRRADDLGHDPGADSDPERPRADARTARIAGERRSRRLSAAASGRRS